MVAVHLQIAVHLQLDIHPAMHADRAQHMVEEADPTASGQAARRPLGQPERETDLRFGGIAFDKRLSDGRHRVHVPFLILLFCKITRSAASSASFSALLPAVMRSAFGNTRTAIPREAR